MWNPSLLFLPPEEEKEEEIIEEGNDEVDGIALAPGTITPTEPNIETSIESGNSKVDIVSPGDQAVRIDNNIDKKLLNIGSKKIDDSFEYFSPDNKEFLNFIDPNSYKQDADTSALIKVLAAEDEKLQEEANENAKKVIDSKLPTETKFDYTNSDSVIKLIESTFKDLYEKDEAITRIRETILKENEEVLRLKQEELMGKLSEYKTFVFPKNYFSSIGHAMTGRSGRPAIDWDQPGWSFTPDQQKMEEELEILNNKYNTFANNLIASDERFTDRISYIENSIYNNLEPVIKNAEDQKVIWDIRSRRMNEGVFVKDKNDVDDLGLGLNWDYVIKTSSGYGAVKPGELGYGYDPIAAGFRTVEKIFGWKPFQLSDTAYEALSNISLNKFTQVLGMDSYVEDLNKFTDINAEYNENGVESSKGELRDKHLPEGDDSYVWYKTSSDDVQYGNKGDWKPLIENYQGYNRDTGEYSDPIYNVMPGIGGLGQGKFPNEKYIKNAKERGYELMKWRDAKPLIIGDLKIDQERILDKGVQILDKEWENGVLSTDKFTDFLSNIYQGNIGDALRYIPSAVIKQIPYMAANYFTMGFYTMVQEGGNISFDIARDKAAEDLYAMQPDEFKNKISLEEFSGTITTDQMMKWVEDNPQKFDDALALGMTAGTGIAGLERAGIGYMIKATKFGMGAFTQLLRGNVKKALSQTKGMLANNAKSGLNEALTEGGQTGMEQLAKGKFNAIEYVESMGEGGLVGTILPFGGAATSSAVTKIIDIAKNTRLNIRDPKFYKKVNTLFEKSRLKLDEDLKAGLIDEVTYEKNLQQISNDRSALLKIPTHFDVESKSETFDIYNSIKEKQKELETIGDNKGLGKPLVDEITVLNERLAEIYAEQNLNKQIGSLNALVDAANDVTMQTFDTKIEADNFIAEQNKTGNWDSKASKDGSGTILQNKETGKQLIIVNKETAAEVRDIAVADHEFLHALMFQTVKDNPKAQAAIGKSLLGYLEKMDKDGQMTELLKERYKVYKGKPVEQQYEEALNFFADAIINEEIKVNDTVVEKIGRLLRNLLQSLPFVNISFKSNKDVYNFVKDYALRRKAGKGLNAAQKRMLTRSSTVGKDLGKGTSSQIADLIENQGGNLNKAFAPQSKRTAQDLMLEYQQEGANMQAELVEDLVNQYYSLGLKAMGYSREAGDIEVEDAVNFLSSQFPSIASNYTETNVETGRPQSLSNYMQFALGARGKGFFKAEIERKKRTVSKEKLEDSNNPDIQAKSLILISNIF